MEEKINVIKQIVTFHPSLGVSMGYSWYEGGMRDTGEWKWNVMVDEPTEILKNFLDKLIYDDKVSNEKINKYNSMTEKEKIQEILDRNKDNPHILKVFNNILNFKNGI